MKTLNINNAALLIIDAQEKLINAQYNKEKIAKNTEILAKAAKILGLSVVVSEQYPKGLGKTIPEVAENLPEDTKYYEKTSFSCCTNSAFEVIMRSTGKKQVIVCGMETHICVHQTVSDLIGLGYEVYLVKDAVGSRNEYESEVGIERMLFNGAIPTCTEMVLFELIKCSSHENFKQIQALIK
jgi:nicotinamidase-related amidase